MKYGKIVTFLGGMLMGTAGVAVLSSKDAKKTYTHCTAAVLRGKDSVMRTAANIKENCGDIYADARDINEKRYDEQKERELENAKAVVEQHELGKQADFAEVNE